MTPETTPESTGTILMPEPTGFWFTDLSGNRSWVRLTARERLTIRGYFTSINSTEGEQQ